MTQAIRMPAELPTANLLLHPAAKGDRDAFQQLAEPFRRELQVHCYRMLGSVQEAEDLVQETFLRAWRSRDRYEGRTSFRNWLYRIATNACLNALAKRPGTRRVLPDTYGPPSEAYPQGKPPTEIAWLEPYPDAALEGIADSEPGPDRRYELRESVQLAFVAAIQELPPRQRAILLLRDVLGWSAIETGRLLDTSVVSVNSALQRAHATLQLRFPAGQPSMMASIDAKQSALLERYVQAWDGHDLDGFVDLLKEDAVLRMPPWREWYLGRDAIRAFFGRIWSSADHQHFRLVRIAANGQPAFAQYSRPALGSAYEAHSIHVLTLQDDAVAVVTAFRDVRLFAAFGLPPRLPTG